jgi:DNA/RNA endonuclease YhcR with UshA esterase domain
MRALVFAAALIASGTPALAVTIAPNDAEKYVGKNVTIEGVVTDVHVSQNGITFIGMGGKYPNNQFVAVIFPQNIDHFGNVNFYEGKTVRIAGHVAKYEGKTDIELSGMGRTEIVDPAQRRKIS